MNRHIINTTKTARYFTQGNLTEYTKSVWFVLHGYGQLSNYFLRSFNSLNQKNNFIIAPEGFHRFYLNGVTGRVGASWMTKEDRENDIKDYVNYLDQLYFTLLSEINNKNITINVLGFSQGGATASRWLSLGKAKIDNLILWAAVFPNDLNFSTNKNELKNSNLTLVIGDNDEYISENKLNEHLEFLDNQKLNYNLILYKGKHRIYPEVLSTLEKSI